MDMNVKFDELREELRTRMRMTEEAANDVGKKYITIKRMIIMGGGSGFDFQNGRLYLMSTEEGRDACALWEMAGMRYERAKAEMELSKFDLEWFIAAAHAGTPRNTENLKE